jgi:hypothetical protein
MKGTAYSLVQKTPELSRSQIVAKRLYFETAIAPGVVSTLQETDVVDSLAAELQRHTGAGSFIRSRTIEDDLAVPRNLLVPSFEIAERQPHRTRDLGADLLHLASAAEIHHRQ